jgi:glycogen operon protein
MDWKLLEKNRDLFRFARNMIAFRNNHPVLRSREHFRNRDCVGSGLADITFHGTRAWQPDWSNGSRVLAAMLCGKHAKGGTVEDNTIYMAMNSCWLPLHFELPFPPRGKRWHVSVNTGMPSPEDIFEAGGEPEVEDQSGMMVGPRSVVILIAK